MENPRRQRRRAHDSAFGTLPAADASGRCAHYARLHLSLPRPQTPICKAVRPFPMALSMAIAIAGMVATSPTSQTGLMQRRVLLRSNLAREKRAVAQTERELAKIDEALSPLSCDIDDVMAPRGYLTKTAGCYLTDGATGPPPSAMTLALKNFKRELSELMATIIPGQSTEANSFLAEGSNVYDGALDSLRLDNDLVWAREEALLEEQICAVGPNGQACAVPAPLLIKLPYLFICNTLDKLYDGSDGKRVLAKFWYVAPLSPCIPSRRRGLRRASSALLMCEWLLHAGTWRPLPAFLTLVTIR